MNREETFLNYIDDRERNWVGIVYAMHLIGIFTGGFAFLIALIISYIRRRGDIGGTAAASHYSYMLRTFWWTVFWGGVSFLLTVVLIDMLMTFFWWTVFWGGVSFLRTVVLIGFAGIVAVAFWYLYRLGKGFYYFFQKEEVPGYPPLT
jgi:uncharacterized membrane protein